MMPMITPKLGYLGQPQYELTESDVDLSAALTSCIQLIRGRTDARTISIRSVLDDLPLRIWADERMIKQIALNLLTNSVKYNVEGGEVVVSAGRTDDGAVFFCVADTGVGIAEEDIQEVLQPFGQARLDVQRAHEGTGLGLSLAKKFVEEHGGALEVKSEIRKGTVVTVRFPADRTR